MPKFQSPLLGYNNNVRHRGRLFHIQTEDSGVNHPHIITHLFMDGGRILKSVKKSYAEHVGSDNMSETVRLLMKEQHKAMFVALRDGQFDELVEGKKPGAGGAAAAVPAAPRVAPPPIARSASVGSRPEEVAVPKGPATQREPQATIPDEETAPATIVEGRRQGASHPANADPPLPPELEALLRDELPPPQSVTSPPRRSTRRNDNHEPRATREPDRHRPAQELTVDFDALDRDSGPSSVFQQPSEPPPRNLFPKEPRTGKYSGVEPTHHDSARGRARPAPMSKPLSPPTSIVSDDLVSDKSLDEVILSYLAEDLDPPPDR